MPATPTQAALFEKPEEPPPETKSKPRVGKPKLKIIERQQYVVTSFRAEDLIPADHKARAIWELTGKLDLSRFEAPIRSEQGQAGRPAWDPRLLVSIWLYCYSEGESSAREIGRRMHYEPGLRWLSGMTVVNHHTLSNFRTSHGAALDGLFVELLGVLDAAEVISLERVMHDGTKIRAQAGVDTFRREKTLAEREAAARELLDELGDPEAQREGRSRKEAAQERARRERAKRLQDALAELKQRQAQADEGEQDKVRVSMTEPEARVMKHGDHAIVPSYNVQLSTDAKRTVVVSAAVTQAESDAHELPPAVEAIEEQLGRKPGQVVVDGGFTNRETLEAMEQQGVEMIGSLPDPAERTAAAMKAAGIDPAFGPASFRWDETTNTLECRAGKCLPYVRRSTKRGNSYKQYRARPEDCTGCEFQQRCCPQPKRGRTVSKLESEAPVVAAFRERMETDEAKEIYRQRGPIAEFPNAWIKERIGLRKFRLRGLVKAGTELLWACLTYNVMQWKRLCWKPAAVPAVTA